jgi:16S rRNA (cytidine1402-2'-O)-methyltransferase
LGRLYIVGTPIGNLEDMSYRAVRILREASVIAAEDTRQTRKLLHHFEIQTPLTSYHEHNQRTAGPALISRMVTGEDVALVTDAGMPAISDPGEDLVRLAVEAGMLVIPIPGPTAFTTALVASGLSTGRFTFEGFLPQKKKERSAALALLRLERRTWILYEAPHRLLATLAALQETLGDRPMAAARELTKLYEEVIRGTPAELIRHFTVKAPRGEFVLVVSGMTDAAVELEPPSAVKLAEAVQELVAGGMDRKAAMKEVGVRFGLSKRDVYQALLDLKGD